MSRKRARRETGMESEVRTEVETRWERVGGVV